MFIRPLITPALRPITIQSCQLSSFRNPAPPPFPTIANCPRLSCAHTNTPAMPEGLEINTRTPLNGTMVPYAAQVLICTGKADWKSRIEDENDGDNVAADLKRLLGRGGVYGDPFHNVLITNSSFPPSVPSRPEVQNTSAYLFPSFKYVPFLPSPSLDSVEALAKGYLLPKKSYRAHGNLLPIHSDRLLRDNEHQSLLFGVSDVKDILVLICGHGGRDGRCGVMGSVLEEEFNNFLSRYVEIPNGPVSISEDDDGHNNLVHGQILPKPTARIGLISHIGGHQFAGNVIVYIPKQARALDRSAHALAGYGIWYGRVEPKHVEGIVKKTIIDGTVIEELFRGAITKDGETLRL